MDLGRGAAQQNGVGIRDLKSFKAQRLPVLLKLDMSERKLLFMMMDIGALTFWKNFVF